MWITTGAGVPLIEIVTEPDVRSAGEAKAFLEKVKSILEYTGVSDCKMQEGSLRCDINLSVRPMGQKELGTRTEIKNINSFSAAVRAIEFERSRQIGLISAGKEVALATLRWDDENGIGYEMRSKEEAHDYRYFPEPDLAPVVIDDGWIEKIKNSLPELPDARKERYVSDFGLPEYDAAFITASRKLADYFEKAVELGAPPKIASNWIMGDISRLLKDRGLEDIPFAPEYLVKTIDLIEKGVVSTTAAKRIVAELFDGEKDPEQIAKEAGLIQVSDESELALLVKQVIDENPKAVAEVRAGKEKAMGFLIGQGHASLKGERKPADYQQACKENARTLT